MVPTHGLSSFARDHSWLALCCALWPSAKPFSATHRLEPPPHAPACLRARRAPSHLPRRRVVPPGSAPLMRHLAREVLRQAAPSSPSTPRPTSLRTLARRDDWTALDQDSVRGCILSRSISSAQPPHSTPPMEAIRIPQQKPIPGGHHLFPAVLAPSPAAGMGLSQFTSVLREWKPQIEHHLRWSGAVLLRGFPVATPSDFNDVVEAFEYAELPYVGGAAPRTNVVGRVFTANESPPDQKIPFHHEMAQVPTFPSKLFFFCEVEPGNGGETPIVLSHHIYGRMVDKYPEFVEKLEELGLIYIRILGREDDPSSPIGRGWQSTFLTKDKNIAEERAAKLGMKLEWTEDGVKTIMGPIPAVKIDERRQRKIWFNSMVAAYTGWKDARNDPTKAITFGDGTPLPADIVEDCLRILEEECVAIPWVKGDILLIDNLAVLHSRRPFDPPRRILASLCK